nr:histidine kinase [uncultured Carboxylicivirga sp.]
MLKDYFAFPKGVEDSLNDIKSSVINYAWIGLIVFIVPILLYDIYLFWNGFDSVFFFKSGLILSFFIMTICGKKLSVIVKVHSYLFVLYLLIITGFYRFGFYSNAALFMIIYIGISFFYLRSREFILSFALISVSYLGLMYLYVNGYIQITFDREFYSFNEANWLVDLMIVFSNAFVILVAMFKIFKAYNAELMNHINSEEKIRHTLNHMPIPVTTINKKREITMVNKAYEAFFNLKKEDTPTVIDWLMLSYPDQKEREEKIEEVRRIIETFDPFKENTIDYKVTLNNGTNKHVKVFHTLTQDEVICTFVDETERIRKRKEIVESIIRTEKKEKERIGRELHDGLGPILTTAKIYAHSLRDEKEVNEEYLQRLDQLLENALKELRMLINDESPHLLQQYGLEKAIRSFLQNIKAITNIEITLTSDPLVIKKDLIEFTLYRAILELINNTIKYSNAKHLSINIKQIDDNLKVEYSDDGIGFVFGEGVTKGNGLLNIQNRINNVGGKIYYVTKPGRGVHVTIQMNVNQEV